MKKLIVILTVLLLLPIGIKAHDSTTPQIASSIYEQLCMDTTGTDRLPRATALKYARIGVDKIGWDLGIEISAPCTSTADAMSMLIDTGLIEVTSITFDSGGYPIRFLRRVPADSITKLQFSHNVTNDKNATHYAVWGDSVLLGPISGDADVFTVRFYKKVKHLSDSTTATDLLEEYRDIAILFGCYKASERLQNGRADKFLERYKEFRNDVWARRKERSVDR